jgi:hypothetical protein
MYELIFGDIVSIESEEIRLVPSGLFIYYKFYAVCLVFYCYSCFG